MFLNNFLFNRVYFRATRFALLNKLQFVNTYQIVSPKSAMVYVLLHNLDNFMSSRVVASFFLLRTITGRKPYISRLGIFQTFKKKNYDVIIQVNLQGKFLLEFIGFLAVEVLQKISDIDLKSSLTCVGSNTFVCFFSVLDMSFIRFVETHSIFFRWKDSFNIKFFFNSTSAADAHIFLDNLKFIKPVMVKR